MWAALLRQLKKEGYELTWLDGPNTPFPAIYIHNFREVRQCSDLYFHTKWTTKYAGYQVIGIAEFLATDYTPPPPPTIEEVFKF